MGKLLKSNQFQSNAVGHVFDFIVVVHGLQYPIVHIYGGRRHSGHSLQNHNTHVV